MANLLDSLPGRDNPVKKLQKEIDGMELKKLTLFTALQKEIEGTRQGVDNELLQIGKEVYQRHLSGADVDEGFGIHFNKIKELKELIMEKEAKLSEISDRYEYEINLLKSQLHELAQMQPSKPSWSARLGKAAATPDGNSCVNCGKPYTPGIDKFCFGCGQQIEAASSEREIDDPSR